MTNKQWIIWKMIYMHPYELGQVLSGRCDTCVARPFAKKNSHRIPLNLNVTISLLSGYNRSIRSMRSVAKMAENKKLEEIVDLLASYGGFDRDYLRDKLLSHCGQEKQDNLNKMEAVAQLFGKRLDEPFCVSCCNTKFLLKFTSDGLWVFDDSWGHWNGEDGMLEALIRGKAVMVDE